jgi:hypothetical protein
LKKKKNEVKTSFIPVFVVLEKLERGVAIFPGHVVVEAIDGRAQVHEF